MVAKGGRQALFERIVAQYGAPMVAYAARVSGNPSAAEDIVQDAFLKLATGWKGPMEPSPQMTLWLRRTVHNSAVDAIRREERLRALHLRSADGGRAPAGPGGDDAVSDAAAEAAEALSILSARERALVVMKVYEGMSYREIAEATGLGGSNVGFILHGARKKLAERLSARKPAKAAPKGGSK